MDLPADSPAAPASPAPLAVRALAAPLRQQVVDRLRAAVIAGDLAPGQRLTERELIDRVGVSRTVIREALRQLESEGLVETVPNKGPVVRALSRAEAVDLYRIRASLEALAARLFIERAPPEAMDRLAAALRDDRAHTIRAVFAVHTDTASGVTSDLVALRRAIDDARHPALLVADAVASLACEPIDMDARGLDIVIANVWDNTIGIDGSDCRCCGLLA
jgi:DNA-binding transcriptional regulator YhcF (GntR family)